MALEVRILADSRAPNGKRLTTWLLTYPRFVHAELMTHRLFSRNSASSRAIPTAKILEQVKNDPAMPVWWGKNQAGMQAREELTGATLEAAKKQWLGARNNAVDSVGTLLRLGLHKQIANRLLEPWMWMTVILSATEFENWFRLRAHPDAQPEIAHVAYEMQKQYAEYQPRELVAGDWHLPLIDDEDLKEHLQPGCNPTLSSPLVKISVARCARVSYVRHMDRKSVAEDIALHDRLLDSGHMSPFEHVARAMTSTPEPTRWSGNFCGWTQYRELIDINFTRVGR